MRDFFKDFTSNQIFNGSEEKKVIKIIKERIIKKDGLVYVVHG